MKVLVIGSGDSDIEIAVKLRQMLTEGQLTPFRVQLLDVIVTNAADLLSYGEADDA